MLKKSQMVWGDLVNWLKGGEQCFALSPSEVILVWVNCVAAAVILFLLVKHRLMKNSYMSIFIFSLSINPLPLYWAVSLLFPLYFRKLLFTLGSNCGKGVAERG